MHHRQYPLDVFCALLYHVNPFPLHWSIDRFRLIRSFWGHMFGFLTSWLLRSEVVSLTPNPQTGEPDLRIYRPPDIGWPSYAPGHWVPILVAFYDPMSYGGDILIPWSPHWRIMLYWGYNNSAWRNTSTHTLPSNARMCGHVRVMNTILQVSKSLHGKWSKTNQATHSTLLYREGVSNSRSEGHMRPDSSLLCIPRFDQIVITGYGLPNN
jgi:hypothetical protein